MNLGFGASLAFIMGILLPMLGFVRTWTTDEKDLGGLFADIICGGMLLLGAVKTQQRPHSGQRFLSAAFGLTFGIFYSSLVAQLQPRAGGLAMPDGYIPEEWTIVPMIAGLLISFVGLVISLRSIRSK